MGENISQWEVWTEHMIREHARANGFVLLICSSEIFRQLSDPNKISQIQMCPSHIGTLALNNLIREEATTHCIIPVCPEVLNEEIVPISLRGRNIYHISFSTLMNVETDHVQTILGMPQLESLRSLVFRLMGESEVYRPPIGKR